MLKEKGSSTVLKSFFKKNKLGKLVDLYQLLNTTSRMTVFRRLQDVQYLTSYTHAGSFYTLKNIPNFDSSNLWYFKGVGFSKHGNLKETVFHLIDQSKSGCTHDELEKKLHIRVQNTLLDLVNSNRVSRTKINREYIYSSILPSKSKNQLLTRNNYSQELKDLGLSDGIIIEILATIIRINHGEDIKSSSIVSELISRGIHVGIEQVNAVLIKFNLKKTLGSP